MSLTCQTLLTTHPQSWQRAIVHPFLGQCQDGTIRSEQFNTWLVQDYQFVVDFTRFVGRVLAAASVAHFEVLLNGLHALQEELIWFRAKAVDRQLTLDVPRQETCQIYCDFMGNLGHAPYPMQATALWAIATNQPHLRDFERLSRRRGHRVGHAQRLAFLDDKRPLAYLR